MDIRPLTPAYAVSPQIAPEDLGAIAAAGYVTVICNRPDGEVPPELSSETMRRAAEAAGLRYFDNPVMPGALSGDNLAIQAEAIETSDGPVLAYCASGNRSSIVWSFLSAADLGVDAVIAATTAAGYQHEPLRPQFVAYANRTA